MLLRTRITLIVAAGFLILMFGFFLASLLRDRIEEGREGEQAIAAQSVLWREIVAVQVAALENALERVEDASTFRVALSFNNRPGIAAALKDLGVDIATEGVAFEVVNKDREVVFSSGGPANRSILDAGSLDRSLAGEQLGGLRQVDASRILLIASRTFTLPGFGTNVLVLGRDASAAVDRFAAGAGSSASLLTLRGRLAASSNPRLWERANLSVTPRRPLFERLKLDHRVYNVASVPVSDVGGSAVGALVALTDATEAFSATRALRDTAVASAFALALIGVIGLNLFLWYSFRPLESAIDVLQALARGDTSVTVDNRGGKDEIGRIANAVVALRGNVQALAESRRQRDRVRRRQEAVISTELKSLADSIDPTDREQVLALLSGPGEVESEQEDELRRFARVLRDLSRRIVEQHTRLSSMVVELREALITKTKLAGLQQELEIARQVQLAILPKDLPPDARFAVHGQMTPAREVGGDFYDFFMVDEDTLGFVVADVSGKGVPAALFMAISRTLLRSTALFERSPAACVRRLNDLLALENEQMLFVTLVYGVVELKTGRVHYVNAGHNPPYHISKAGEIETFPTTNGMAVAVLDGFVYKERQLQLTPGDTLFLYTDGVTEAFDLDGAAYGDERLKILLASGANTWSVQDLPERVLASVHVFERGAPQADDITCLALRFFGPEPRHMA